MKKTPLNRMHLSAIVSCVLGVACLSTIAAGETMLNLKMGPVWPKELRNKSDNQITAWEPSVEIGGLFNKIVGVGFGAQFQWKKKQSDSTYTDAITQSQRTIVGNVERFFLFPPTVFILIDPVPKLIVHPVIKGEVGMTLLYYGYKWYDLNGNENTSDDSGMYLGVFGKASADALYNLGENVAVYAGFAFQWGSARHRISGTSNQYYTKQIYGPGIDMGFRFNW
jgi:hypothetical protein